MQLHRMVAEPSSPDNMVWSTSRNDRPEPRPVTKDAQVGELVDDDRVEGLGRGKDQPPREGQTTLPRGTPPARSLVPHGDGRW
jgi:hypothetical protein